MKSMYILFAVLIFTATTANAQQKRDTVHATGIQQKVKMKDELGLNKKQAAELKTSKKNFKEQEKKVKADSSLSPQQRKTALKKIKAEKKQKTDSVLTPEQQAKLKTLKKEKKDAKKASQ